MRVQNVRDFPQTKPESENTAPFLSNEHGDPRFFFQVFAKNSLTRCFCEAYTGLPVVRATENQKALNCVVLKYSIPVSEEQQIKEKRETLASGLTC